jgi:hypothetical protein
MATYVHIDQTDLDYFEHVLQNDVERLAFINYFAHVATFSWNKRTSTSLITSATSSWELWREFHRPYIAMYPLDLSIDAFINRAGQTDTPQARAPAMAASRTGTNPHARTGLMARETPSLFPS